MEWNPGHGAPSYMVQTEAAKTPNDGLPHSFKVALLCGISEAKGQTSMQGFVGPVIATAGALIWRCDGKSAAFRTERRYLGRWSRERNRVPTNAARTKGS